MATKKTKKKMVKKAAKNVAKKVARKASSVVPKKKVKPAKKRIAKRVAPKQVAKRSVALTPKKNAKTAKPAKRNVSAKKFVERKIRGKADEVEVSAYASRGMGGRSGGQSGDTQGLSGRPETDSESVEELLEEGQAFEAEVVQGIENVPVADQGEVRTHEVPEDDVPEEYLGEGNQK